MKISDIGGEGALIKRLTSNDYDDPAIVKGVGDDCAVLEYTSNKYLLVTVDMMVQDDHFRLDWFTPDQIGKKLMESNVSDIIAMGGKPRWAFISLSLPDDLQVEFMDEFYAGLYDSARRHSVVLIGGDTTHGRSLVLNLAILGDIDKDDIRLRSHARPGDYLCVTGTVGKSRAGLRLLQEGKNEGLLESYLEPRCRLESEGKAIARYAHAMIDVSDGLSSELIHICEESKTGGYIVWEDIPLSPETIKAAQILSEKPQDYALSGGEDFELLFTIPLAHISSLRNEFTDFTIIGEILPKESGIYVTKQGQKIDIGRGYDHFAG